MSRATFEALRKGGFAGRGDYVELCDGLFFPRAPLPDIQSCGVAGATSLKMAFGSPALLLGQADSSGRYEVVDVGLYAGIKSDTGASLALR